MLGHRIRLDVYLRVTQTLDISRPFVFPNSFSWLFMIILYQVLASRVVGVAERSSAAQTVALAAPEPNVPSESLV